MDIYKESGAIIKMKWNEVFIKNKAFLIRDGFLMRKGEWSLSMNGEGRAAQEVREMFLWKLTDPVSRWKFAQKFMIKSPKFILNIKPSRSFYGRELYEDIIL